MEEQKTGYFSAVVNCRCPRCREGRLFKNPLSINIRKNMAMYKNCPICGQATEIEIGFYYGTGYVSYLIALFISLICFIFWWVIIGFSFTDNRFLYWIIFNSVLLIVLQPWLMRFSRSLWLSFFVKYDADWNINKPVDPERIVEGEMNNW
jgi:uncharacterized protein (DUF983 family)